MEFFCVAEDLQRIEKFWEVFCENKKICKIHGFHRNSRGIFCHFCIVDFEFYENISNSDFKEILNFIVKNFYSEFVSGAIAIVKNGLESFFEILKSFGFEEKNVKILEKNGFFVRSATENLFTVIPFKKNILHITDGTSSFCTVILGTVLALVIDTMWGTTDLKGLLKILVKTPFKVLNTHAHPDHSFGNYFFEKVFIHKADWPVFAENSLYLSKREEHFFREEDKIKFLELKNPQIEELNENQIFDLGNFEVKTVLLYGHTRGSVGFFIPSEKILISGDAISSELWIFMKESGDLKKALENYKMILNLDFENIISAHSKIMHKKDLLKVLIKNLENIVNKNYSVSSVQNIMDYSVGEVLYSEDEIESKILINFC